MGEEKKFFNKDQLVHIASRAVDERKIFQDRNDCLRFVFQLYVANIGTPKTNIAKKNINYYAEALLKGEQVDNQNLIADTHKPFVYIIDFSLVVNHYHLYILVNTENSIPQFIMRLNAGFAKYFNLKHNRKGALFGSRYKSVLINSDFQADAVSRYVSVVNPLDVYQPGWREAGLSDPDAGMRFLENYEFSSFPDKIGKRKSLILAPLEILKKYSFLQDDKNETGDYKNFIKEFLKEKTKDFPNIIFE